jgi:hypothetical protein
VVSRILRSIEHGCAITVPESFLLHALGLTLSEKQMPRFAGKIDGLSILDGVVGAGGRA